MMLHPAPFTQARADRLPLPSYLAPAGHVRPINAVKVLANALDVSISALFEDM